MFDTIIAALLALSAWEGIAALLGAGYIILAARESQWCWPLAFASTLIYTLLFWEGQLPMQALLNFYYMGMAVYGYLLWRQHQNKAQAINIRCWPLKNHLYLLIIASIISLILGYYLAEYVGSKLPYLDAFVMVFSISTTWMMAQKILENWRYWIVIDSAAIWLYWQSGFYATVGLFCVYLILAIIGWLTWQQHFHMQHKKSPTSNSSCKAS